MHKTMMCVIPMLVMGCDSVVEDISCTLDLRYSVTVSVEDDAGDPVTDATVTYSVDGETPVACEQAMDGLYPCGPEIEGDITVSATADGLGTDEQTVTVSADECHVITESVTLILPIQD